MILFSIIIPMYNSSRTIERSLNSVFEQSVTSSIKEIIVVNDGSIDNGKEKVINYQKTHTTIPIIIVDMPNGGVSKARNRGMQLAKGNWIALLDSDDEWKKNKLQQQVNIISNSNEIDFLGGSHRENELKILGKKIDSLYKISIIDICLKSFPQTSTVIFKKKIFDELGGYDEQQRYGEDVNYFMKICNNYNAYYYPSQTVIYDSGKSGFGSIGLSANLLEMHKGQMKNINELVENKFITKKQYSILKFFYFCKFIRRRIITFLRRILNE